MKKLELIITRAGLNNILQASEWLTLAAASGMKVNGFFEMKRQAP